MTRVTMAAPLPLIAPANSISEPDICQIFPWWPGCPSLPNVGVATTPPGWGRAALRGVEVRADEGWRELSTALS